MPITTAGTGRLWVVWPITAAATWMGSITWVASQIGIGGVGLGLASSIVISIPIVAVFLWLNSWTRGRSRLLLSPRSCGEQAWRPSVRSGRSSGCIPLVDMVWGTDVGVWVRPLVITPVTEEVLKSLFLIWLLVYRRREIMGVLDGHRLLPDWSVPVSRSRRTACISVGPSLT